MMAGVATTREFMIINVLIVVSSGERVISGSHINLAHTRVNKGTSLQVNVTQLATCIY